MTDTAHELARLHEAVKWNNGKIRLICPSPKRCLGRQMARSWKVNEKGFCEHCPRQYLIDLPKTNNGGRND